MAGFLIDEDMNVAVAAILRSQGYQAFAVEELGLKGATDDVVLFTGMQRGYLVVTHNIDDFTLLNNAWIHWRQPVEHCGILMVPQKYRFSPGVIAQHVAAWTLRNPAASNKAFLLNRQGVNASTFDWEEVPAYAS